MAESHLLVATSVREGWGLVVSEAAALGTPTVAYDVDGLRDSVRAANGRLASPTPAALAAEVLAALPGWIEHPPPPLRNGGCEPWPVVVDAVLRAATAASGIAAQDRPSAPTVLEPVPVDTEPRPPRHDLVPTRPVPVARQRVPR
jgi:hypothetical protein